MADLTITAASVMTSTDARTQTVTAGEAVTRGQTVYRNGSDSEWYKADADLSQAASKAGGIVLNDAADGQELEIVTKDDDFDPGATLIKGKVYVQSGTAGGIAPIDDLAGGDYLTIIGYAKTTSTMKLLFEASGVLTT